MPGKAAWLAAGLPAEGSVTDDERVSSVVRRDVPRCRVHDTVGDVIHRLGGWEMAVVVEDGVVLGRLDADRARQAAPEESVEANMEPAPSTFRPSITRRELAGWMEKQKRDRPVVITTLDGRLVGLAYRPDLGPGG